MAGRRESRTFVADFETTVYPNQTFTEVWAAAIVEIGTENTHVVNSIEKFFDYLYSLQTNCIVYFHNLKFDGSFILSYLMRIGYKDSFNGIEFPKERQMQNNSYSYSISYMGIWYWIKVRHNSKTIEFRDSLKLLPMAVKRIGDSFGTKHKKLAMEYTGYRVANGVITPEEKKYIENDVLVVKEALEIMFQQGHTKLTIGSCCMDEFKNKIPALDYSQLFPDVYEIKLNEERFGYDNVGEYIRSSYHGGWCYLVHGEENKVKTTGCTNDVNSLYPSMMHSESGNKYPVGSPHFWKGNFIPERAMEENKYYFVRFRTRFYLKDGYLPTIQIKRNKYYKSTEWLWTSDVLHNGEYHKFLKAPTGELIPTTVTLTMTMTDFKLMQDHYDLKDFEILSGCWFYAEKGIFDEYINKYRDIKVKSKGAVREIAKLFLNNLYGKLAASTDSSFCLVTRNDNGAISFTRVHENNKKAGYIPCGSAITSYARNFTIRAAQANYHPHGRGFVYADTDSIHCDLPYTDIKGINCHPTAFCCWKTESYWDKAVFAGQKRYIEHITHSDGEPVNPYYDIKCCGMPDKCKRICEMAMTGRDITEELIEEYQLTDEECDFIETGIEMTDFKAPLKVPGSLKAKKIKGGTVLVSDFYTMH